MAAAKEVCVRNISEHPKQYSKQTHTGIKRKANLWFFTRSFKNLQQQLSNCLFCLHFAWLGLGKYCDFCLNITHVAKLREMNILVWIKETAEVAK